MSLRARRAAQVSMSDRSTAHPRHDRRPAWAGAGRWLALGCLLAVVPGCAAIPWQPAPRTALHARLGPQGWLDLRGVVHVHTSGSHDSPGTIDEVVRAAAHAGVSWVALTEHTRPGTLPAYGRVGGVTIIPGYEIRAAGGSILAIGLSERPPEIPEVSELLQWIHAAGAVGFVGHLERSRLANPAAYREVPLDGIELFNLHAAARERRSALAARLLFLPAPLGFKALLRTPTANLARWAELPEARAIVAGVDAHAKFRLLGRLGGKIDRYRDLFRLLTTHVLARDAEISSILEALRAGRSYVAVEGLGAVDSFRFEPRGDAYQVSAPRVARLALVCDATEVASQLGETALLAPPPDARQCRAEAWLGEHLWVVTSYRDAPAGVANRSGHLGP